MGVVCLQRASLAIQTPYQRNQLLLFELFAANQSQATLSSSTRGRQS